MIVKYVYKLKSTERWAREHTVDILNNEACILIITKLRNFHVGKSTDTQLLEASKKPTKVMPLSTN